MTDNSQRKYVPPSLRRQQRGDSFSVGSDSNESPGLTSSISTPNIHPTISSPEMPFMSMSSQIQVNKIGSFTEGGGSNASKTSLQSARSFSGLLHSSNSMSSFPTRHSKSSQRIPDKLDLLLPPPAPILFKESANQRMIIDYSSMEQSNIKVEYPKTMDKGENRGTYQGLAFKDFSAETLKALHFPKGLVANIERLRYLKPTPIQEVAIPLILSSIDILATSQTGSGKTFSFLAPIITKLLNSKAKEVVTAEERKSCVAYPLAVVLSPTRELTQQIALMCFQLTYHIDLTVRLVYGGEGVRAQESLLREGCDILIATPGRLKDFLEKGRLNLKYVQIMVLDEADRMLDMGFESQIRELVQGFQMPGNGARGNRQTLMFSATFEKGVQSMATRYLCNEARIHVGQIGSTTTTIKQQFEYFPGTGSASLPKRIDKLVSILTSPESVPNGSFLTLVFVETKRDVSYIVTKLLGAGLQVCEMHGDLEQRERQNNLKSFKDGKTPVLVATDVAQRGIDIGGIRHVINFDFPRDMDTYIHRIGRTGRAGAEGLATSFITSAVPGHILDELRALLSQLKQPIPKFIQEGTLTRYKSAGGKSGYKSYRSNRRDTHAESDDASSDSVNYIESDRARATVPQGRGFSEAATPSNSVTPMKVEQKAATRWD